MENNSGYMKSYITWLKITAAVQILTCLAHAMSFLMRPSPQNDTEKQLFDLLETYSFDMGAGFHRTMEQLINVLSAHFSLAYLLAGLINWYLAITKPNPSVIKGILNINLLIFAISVVVNVMMAFLPPITLTVLSFLLLVITRFSMPKS
jgi:hypothetical protein